MLGLFMLFSVTIWYLIDILKQNLSKAGMPDAIYNLVIWAIALGAGFLVAFQFKLDAFVMASEIMNGVLEVPKIEPSITGYVFGGLVLASGSGGVNAFLKAIKGDKTE